MKIDVEYRDGTGLISQRVEKLSFLGFLKNLALAGQGYMPTIKLYTRVIGMLLHYIEYLSPVSFYQSRFSEPPPERRDPTEKGQFSNLVGKAIGDALAKRLSQGKVTLSYEAAMVLGGHTLSGRRPDLYCLGSGFQFAIEAKGRSAGNISTLDMIAFKDQSRQGPLPVSFSIASIAYDLFGSVKTKYYDPVNENSPYNEQLNRSMLQLYYRGLFEYLEGHFRVRYGELEGIECFFVQMVGPDTPYMAFINGNQMLELVLAKSFKKYISLGDVEQPEFHDSWFDRPSYFLDTDGIGLAVTPYQIYEKRKRFPGRRIGVLKRTD